jgi:AraC-like DNA-binding protein
VIKRVLYAETGVAPPKEATCLPYFRMNLVLSGVVPVVLAQSRDVSTIRMFRDWTVVCPPYAWNMHPDRSRGSVFGLVLRPNFLRLISSGPREAEAAGLGPRHWFHTGRPLPGPARTVAEALREHAEQGGDQQTARHLLLALLRLCREELATDAERPAAEKAKRTYEHAMAYLQEHFHEPINRDSVARALDLHPNYVSRLFRQHAGQTLVGMLRRMRLERAVLLLADPVLSINEIMARSGFGDPGHFFRVFRQTYGMSPGAYRANTGSSGMRP